MLEVGVRLASRLPIVFACDYTARGEIPELPLSLNSLAVTGCPARLLRILNGPIRSPKTPLTRSFTS